MNERDETGERPERQRTSFDQDPPPAEDPLLRREEAAAAAEAAGIGGSVPDVAGDEASRPLVEAGQGEAEGFELSERDLIDQASHAEDRRDPMTDAFTPEVEGDQATSVYAEPDEIEPTEVVSDPREGPHDPGAGPGIAPDR